MHRNNLRNLLESYRPTDESEIANRLQMLDFLNDHEDCFERSLATGHFTGSCWIENQDGTKFLLALHKKVGLWLQLGGHADGDKDIARVALKEAYEESGLKHIELVSPEIFDIDIHLFQSRKKEVPDHYHYDIRFLLRTSDENINISDESEDLRWFETLPSENLGERLDRMYEKWKQSKK